MKLPAISVPRSQITLLNRRKVWVDEFEIEAEPVSTAQYALFSKVSGYITENEANDCEYNFYNNPTFNKSDYIPSISCFAICLNYIDCVEYSKYYSMRLPTLYEWLSFTKFVKSNNLFRLNTNKTPNAVKFSGDEWLAMERQNIYLIGRGPVMKMSGYYNNPLRIKDAIVENPVLFLGASFRLVLSR